MAGGHLLLGAVGQLQFEVVAHRLQTEYKAEALYSPSDIHTAPWLAFPDEDTRRRFEREQAGRLALDVDGNPGDLASNRYNLELTLEKWPRVTFHATREHGQRVG